MAERKKKKKQPKGMPKESIQSRIPSKAAKGQAGKKSKLPGLTGAVKAAKARRKKRKSKVKSYVSGVKKKVREYHAERGQKRSERALKDMGGAAGLPSKKSKKRGSSVSKVKSALRGVTQSGRRKKIGASKGTKVRKGAVGVQKTKGGEYVKYGKKSAAAGSFRKAFKSGCAGGAKSFSWDGRSYSCRKK